MKNWSILLLTLLVIACSQPKRNAGNFSYQPLIPLDSVLKSMASFDNYLGSELLPDLSGGDYLVYDSLGNELTTEQFVSQFSSGDYLPLKMKVDQDTALVYQLLSVKLIENEQVQQFLQFIGGQYALFEQLKHKALPNFHFVDLNDREYSAANMNDKLVVVKFWFIGCKPCIAEMPKLNQLVAQYKDREDIVFLSLANDDAEDLKQFLDKNKFDYAVVADKAAYTMNTLGIGTFPTHMIVKNGIVEEITTNATQLENALIKQANRL